MVPEVWARHRRSFLELLSKIMGGAFVAQLIKWPGNHRVRITYCVRPEWIS